MRCTPEQIGSNPNHNIAADVSTHTHAHTRALDLYAANPSRSLKGTVHPKLKKSVII